MLDQLGVRSSVFGDDFTGAVVRTIIADKDFQNFVRLLIQHTFQALPNVGALIEGGDAHRDGRWGRTVFSLRPLAKCV